MVEMLKKSIFATIGIALMTRDKVEEVGKRIAAEARLSESDGKQFVDELLKRADETRKSFEKSVVEHVEAAIKKVNMVPRSEFDALAERVRNLENPARQEE